MPIAKGGINRYDVQVSKRNEYKSNSTECDGRDNLLTSHIESRP